MCSGSNQKAPSRSHTCFDIHSLLSGDGGGTHDDQVAFLLPIALPPLDQFFPLWMLPEEVLPFGCARVTLHPRSSSSGSSSRMVEKLRAPGSVKGPTCGSVLKSSSESWSVGGSPAGPPCSSSMFQWQHCCFSSLLYLLLCFIGTRLSRPTGQSRC